jgi:subtilisin family serine protease
MSLISFSLLLSNCSPTKLNNDFSRWGFSDEIYSTRPQASTPLIALLKLNAPALLETATRKDGKLVVDPVLATAIAKEQEATIAELQKISPEIHVLLRYKLVLNAITIVTPPEFFDRVAALPNVTLSERSASFSRPQSQEPSPTGIVGPKTSVRFIGADKAHERGFRGEGMRIGVIDTGIDYTHKMFAGEGTKEAYKAINPSQANAAFPSKKVVGGIDLVGTEYDSASPDFAKHLPIPDMNPLDEAGHGTHVAGTIAGAGDDINTYSGVAPAADLYAIKVFGAHGSTGDEVVIAALEYAMDPAGDLKFENQLDVVNLSLGSGYGSPHLMYSHAIKNLVRGGTNVVISAGNSGDTPYVVGSPGVAEEAISVASSIDNMNQNVLFPTASFQFGDEVFSAEAVEASITKPLSSITELKGEVIAVGLADTDFTPPLKDQIRGKVALIDRGKVTFSEKIRRAQEAGAIAVVVANNDSTDPIGMGGEGKYDIPAVMVLKSAGDKVKENLAKGVVTVDLKSGKTLEKPWLVDTISPFSSRGPRSEDGLIKPEIAAPGSNIISADRGSGDQGIQMSGTSMAAPHIAGVMALLKQRFPTLTPFELKSVLMGHAKVIADKDKKTYSISRQGAGRVQVAESLDAKLVVTPASLSLGNTDIEKQKTLAREITLKNIGTEAMTVKMEWAGTAALQFSAPSVVLAPGESKVMPLTVKILAAAMTSANQELDVFLNFSTDKEALLQMPVLTVTRQISQIKATTLKVHSTSPADGAGSTADIELQNAGVNKGKALMFNMLGSDDRKKDKRPDLAHNRNCDMQSAGYRIIEREGAQVLQVAVKLYERMTTWNTCEVNVQIDSNNDALADQEIAGVPSESLPGLPAQGFVSILLDGNKARELRKKFEAEVENKVKHPEAKDPVENYTEAVQALSKMQMFDNSTLAIVEANVTDLQLAETGELRIKVSTTHQDSGVIEYDDYLGNQAKEWEKVSTSPLAQSFAQLPEAVDLAGGETKSVSLLKGYGLKNLILYSPQNRAVQDPVLQDGQSQVVQAVYGE